VSFLGQIERDLTHSTAFRGGIAEGANLRTPCGPRRVELVRPGDLIVTRTGGLMPVRMVWSRIVTQADMVAAPHLAPLKLMPRALGPMMPQAPLSVAPNHRLLVPGFRLWGMEERRSYLVEAQELAGRSDAVFVDRARADVRYFQFVFDTHQVMLVNGLPVESFLPDPGDIAQLAPEKREDLVRRFPQFLHEPGAYPPAEFPIACGVEYMPFVA
jgi:hypothetical protein